MRYFYRKLPNVYIEEAIALLTVNNSSHINIFFYSWDSKQSKYIPSTYEANTIDIDNETYNVSNNIVEKFSIYNTRKYNIVFPPLQDIKYVIKSLDSFSNIVFYNVVTNNERFYYYNLEDLIDFNTGTLDEEKVKNIKYGVVNGGRYINVIVINGKIKEYLYSVNYISNNIVDEVDGNISSVDNKILLPYIDEVMKDFSFHYFGNVYNDKLQKIINGNLRIQDYPAFLEPVNTSLYIDKSNNIVTSFSSQEYCMIDDDNVIDIEDLGNHLLKVKDSRYYFTTVTTTNNQDNETYTYLILNSKIINVFFHQHKPLSEYETGVIKFNDYYTDSFTVNENIVYIKGQLQEF